VSGWLSALGFGGIIVTVLGAELHVGSFLMPAWVCYGASAGCCRTYLGADAFGDAFWYAPWAWIANPTLWIALALAALRRPVASALMAVAAVFVALSGVFDFMRGHDSFEPLIEVGAWIGSMVLIAVGEAGRGLFMRPSRWA